MEASMESTAAISGWVESLQRTDLLSIALIVVFLIFILAILIANFITKGSIYSDEVFRVSSDWEFIRGELLGRYSSMAGIVAQSEFDIVRVTVSPTTSEAVAGGKLPPEPSQAPTSPAIAGLAGDNASGGGSCQASTGEPIASSTAAATSEGAATGASSGEAREQQMQSARDSEERTKIQRLEITEKMLYTDFVIEKAQKNLTLRSKSYFENGERLYKIALLIIFGFAAFLYYSTEINVFFHKVLMGFGWSQADFESEEIRMYNAVKGNPGYFYFMVILKRIVSGGAILGGAYVIAATANSCFRESTILLHRRHLLRYVRLLSYERQGNISTKDLRDVFGVDDATKTGFDKIRTETIRDNLVGKLLEAVGGIVHRIKEKDTSEKSDQKGKGKAKEKDGDD